MVFGTLMCYFFRVGSKAILGSTHIAKQLLFSQFPSVLAFNVDVIFGLFWLLGA